MGKRHYAWVRDRINKDGESSSPPTTPTPTPINKCINLRITNIKWQPENKWQVAVVVEDKQTADTS